MKNLLATFCSFLIGCMAFAQQPTDFYFVQSLPQQCKELQKIPANFQGKWQSKKDTLRSVIITDKKIYTQYKHVMYYPVKDLKKAKYTLKDNYLYGFSEYDSLPATVINDTVVFCYISDHELVNMNLEEDFAALSELKNGLLLSKKADSVFAYTFVRIEKGELQIMEVDHEMQLDKVMALCKPKEVENADGETIAYLADPDKKQMEKFISSGYFNIVQRCKKQF